VGHPPFWWALGSSGRLWEALEDREGGGSRWLVGRLWEALEDREGLDPAGSLVFDANWS